MTEDLSHLLMPFTANRRFRDAPRLLVRAEGMYYETEDGRRLLDGAAGMWCVAAGHNRAEITAAIQEQAAKMDYAPPFQMGHPLAFEAAAALSAVLPERMDRVFFSNSGSEAVETALKLARAYFAAKGEPARQRLIGRARDYHGVNFGGMAVGGIASNRAPFGVGLAAVAHLPHTHGIAGNEFSRGQPAGGAERADALEDLIATYGAGTIAAVIVEPMAGSTGVLVPPVGYLERLREICSAHGILLIFDEVITGFGRLGAATAAERFGVIPDIMTFAKALTNGAVPMGATAMRREIFERLMDAPEGAIEFPHGYTYSGHPLACAAALATLALHAREGLYARAARLEEAWRDAVHGLAQSPGVADIRDIGLVAGIELAPREGRPGARGYEVLGRCFDAGALVRVTGDTIAMSPPLVIDEDEIAILVGTVGEAIKASA